MIEKKYISRLKELAGIITESDTSNAHLENNRIKSEIGLLLSVDDDTKNKLENKVLPSGQTRLPSDGFHITLTSIKEFKLFLSDMKNLVLPMTWSDGSLVEIPKVEIGEYRSVYRPEQKKETYVASLTPKSQVDLKDFVDKLYAEYGHKNPEERRFFHITVSNNAGGDSFQSIGNVDAEDFK
jgi:hypothetical protein